MAVYPELAEVEDNRIVCVAFEAGNLTEYWNVQLANFSWNYGTSGSTLAVNHSDSWPLPSMLSDGLENVYLSVAKPTGNAFQVYKLTLSSLTWAQHGSDYDVDNPPIMISMERKPPSAATTGYIFYSSAGESTLYYGTLVIEGEEEEEAPVVVSHSARRRGRNAHPGRRGRRRR
jgi:hypothetical protein